MEYKYKVKALNVVDGDTLDVLIDVGFNIHLKERVRLYGVDTPETRTKDKEEKAAGKKAKIFVEQFVTKMRDLYIESYKEGKFGRYLVSLYGYDYNMISPHYCLNEILIQEGLAKPYYGGKR